MGRAARIRAAKRENMKGPLSNEPMVLSLIVPDGFPSDLPVQVRIKDNNIRIIIDASFASDGDHAHLFNIPLSTLLAQAFSAMESV